MQELCCILKEEIVLPNWCGKVLTLQTFLLILVHSRVHPAAVTLCCMTGRIHGRYIHSQSLLLQQKSLASEPELFQPSHYSWMQLIATGFCSGKDVGGTGQHVLELKVTAGPQNRYSSRWRLWKWDGQSNPGCVLGRLSLVLLFHDKATCLPARWMGRGKFPMQETEWPNQNY